MGSPLVTPPLGIAPMANSLPVVLASDDPLRADTASIRASLEQIALQNLLREEVTPSWAQQ